MIGEKDYWGKGIGREATRITMVYAFEKLKIRRVVLPTSGMHESAIRIYEDSEFKTYEVKKDVRDVFYNGKWMKSGTVKMEALKV